MAFRRADGNYLSPVEDRGFPSNSTEVPMYNVMEMSCLNNYNKVACIRSSILSTLAFLTALLCIVKLIRLHIAKHPSCHQYVIFYAAGLECVIGGIHWTFWNVTQLDFLLHYIKLLQVLLMCHYYITLAIRALRKEYWADRFMYPFLFLAVLYFTVMATFAIFNTQPIHVECLAPYWLSLSAAELLVVQVFFVSGFYITRRLNEISTLDSVRWAQKRDLWCIVIVFELSALGTFVYDLVLQILGDREAGCSAIFSHQQSVYSPLLVSLMMEMRAYGLVSPRSISINPLGLYLSLGCGIDRVLKLLLPIWVMMLVFQPTINTTCKDGENVMPGYSDDGTYGSIFSEDLAYRQLYQPGENIPYAVSATDLNVTTSPCMYDPAVPFAYHNPGMPHSSSLQPILEEGVEQLPSGTIPTAADGKKKKVKKVRKVKILSPKDPSTPRKKGRGKKVARMVCGEKADKLADPTMHKPEDV